MIIEHGTPKDIDELEALYNSINDHLEAGMNYPGWKKGIYPVRENAEEGIAAGNLYVARIGDRIAGTIILNHDIEQGYATAEWKIEATKEEAYVIHTLVVHPEFLHQGIGRSLLEFADELGIQNKMKSLRLDVYEKNLPAIELYEKCGYHYIATVDLGYRSYGLDWFLLYEKPL